MRFIKINENFENISLDIGNEVCSYFYHLGLCILQKKDFVREQGNRNANYSEHVFFKNLPTNIKYDFDNIYDDFVENDVTYDSIYGNWDLSTWEIKDNNIHSFWKCMKPLVHKMLDETFQKTGLVKKVDYPIIHFRCADTPFLKKEGYYLQYYSFFKKALENIETKTGRKYKKISIMSCSSHNSDEKEQESCNIYTKSLETYLKENGYESETICNSNIDDFATLFYAPAVISTSSSFSFMSGFFGNGVFVATEFDSGKKCDDCHDWTLYGYNLPHENVADYHDTTSVVEILKGIK
jgi:hypothetical protein